MFGLSKDLLLLLATDLEVSGTLKANKVHAGALVALELKDNLLGGLDVLVEDRLLLTTETLLLAVITTLTYSKTNERKR